MDSGKPFSVLSIFQHFPLNLTTPRDSENLNYRELVTIVALHKSLAECGVRALSLVSATFEIDCAGFTGFDSLAI